MKGLGIYLNSADMQEPPKKIAQKLVDSGCSWAALWLESPDGRRISQQTLVEMSDAISKKGIEVWVWIFPNFGKEEEVARRTMALANAAKAKGIILDIELPFKGKSVSARKLVAAFKNLLAIMPMEIAFTSYPFGHRTLPWDAFPEISTIGQPQLYESADSEAKIAMGFNHYKKLGYTNIVPLVSSYIENQDRLQKSLDRVCLRKGQLVVSGVGVWVLRTTDAAERAVLKAFAQKWFGVK
jgi:hypothetical protein